MPTVNDLLAETEKILNSNGWRRGSFGSPSKGRDLEAALATAAGRIGAQTVLWQTRARLRIVTGDYNLVHWNDTTAANLADVVRVLHGARG